MAFEKLAELKIREAMQEERIRPPAQLRTTDRPRGLLQPSSHLRMALDLEERELPA
jgi:hypothetical protein